MRSFILTTLAWVLLAPSQTVIDQEPKEAVKPLTSVLSPSEENVVASELMGEWIADREIGARLGGQSDHAGKGPIVFRKSKESEERIVAFFNKILAQVADIPDPAKRQNISALQTVYLAGEVEFKNKKQDFALIALFGTPQLIFYDREDELENENVMLARDEAGNNDLLFLAGDFNNQSFGAFKRVVKKESD